MILVGNQRGGARDMAFHLLKDENDHVQVYEIDGFSSDSLLGALKEVHAISKATRCRQFLYSLSVNPPPGKEISTGDFVKVIDEAGRRLGLQGQPRVIVFHEKQGRRHAHCVWSRIDTAKMTAIHLPHTKRKLVALTREIFIERDWKLPDGLIDKRLRNPRNFSLAEWQQAKRIGKDPRIIKTALQDAWAVSDSRSSFKGALHERGFVLARGDRRGYVALDYHGEVYSLTRALGVKSKALKSRLGDFRELPKVSEAQSKLALDLNSMFSRLQQNVDRRTKEATKRFTARHKVLIQRQRRERSALSKVQENRMEASNRIRADRFRHGLGGLWDRLRGEHKRIQTQNQSEAFAQEKQDQVERDNLVFGHLRQRQRLDIFKLRYAQVSERMTQDLVQERQSSIAPNPEH